MPGKARANLIRGLGEGWGWIARGYGPGMGGWRTAGEVGPVFSTASPTH